MRIPGTVALITGGAQGLGKAFAEALVKRGGKVCLVDVATDAGKKTADDLNRTYGENSAAFYRCDVTVKEDLENAFLHTKKTFGKIDIVSNNAGIMHEKNWEKMFAINVTAVYRGTLLGLEHLRKDQGNNGGVVVNTSSMAGLVPISFTPAYSASKHAVIGMTRSWGADTDFPKHQVRFNCICPSFADTDIINITDDQIYHKEFAEKIIKSRGLLPVKFVAEAFIQIIEDDSQNGSVMAVTTKKGIEYVQGRLFEPLGLCNGPGTGNLSTLK